MAKGGNHFFDIYFIGPASRMFLILRLFMTCWI